MPSDNQSTPDAWVKRPRAPYHRPRPYSRTQEPPPAPLPYEAGAGRIVDDRQSWLALPNLAVALAAPER